MSTPSAERPSPDIRQLKPRRLYLAQDGHSHLEQAIYELLWNEYGAANSNDECRQARAGYHRIAGLLYTAKFVAEVELDEFCLTGLQAEVKHLRKSKVVYQTETQGQAVAGGQ